MRCWVREGPIAWRGEDGWGGEEGGGGEGGGGLETQARVAEAENGQESELRRVRGEYRCAELEAINLANRLPRID